MNLIELEKNGVFSYSNRETESAASHRCFQR